MKYLIGVDEVGRGPLAGPVAVGVTVVSVDFDWSLLAGVTDSKQLSEQKRETIFELAKNLKAEARLDYAVSMVAATVIDKIGIVPAINTAMQRALHKITIDPDIWVDAVVKLDGGLKAPAHFLNQETIIKGDSKEQVIGLASIMAKVTRDRYMEKVARKPEFVAYNLAQHKGYGTKQHQQAIRENGLSLIHRKSFCRNLLT